MTKLINALCFIFSMAEIKRLEGNSRLYVKDADGLLLLNLEPGEGFIIDTDSHFDYSLTEIFSTARRKKEDSWALYGARRRPATVLFRLQPTYYKGAIDVEETEWLESQSPFSIYKEVDYRHQEIAEAAEVITQRLGSNPTPGEVVEQITGFINERVAYRLLSSERVDEIREAWDGDKSSLASVVLSRAAGYTSIVKEKYDEDLRSLTEILDGIDALGEKWFDTAIDKCVSTIFKREELWRYLDFFFDGYNQDTLTVLQRREGKCDGLTHLFIDLAHCFNIHTKYINRDRHMWAACLLPPYGWVEVDVSQEAFGPSLPFEKYWYDTPLRSRHEWEFPGNILIADGESDEISALLGKEALRRTKGGIGHVLKIFRPDAFDERIETWHRLLRARL